MSSWVTWRTRNTIYEYDRKFASIFIEPSQYRDCYGADNGKLHPVIRYNGPTCFYKSPRASEDSAGTIIENEARRWYNSTVKDGKNTKRHVRHLLNDFFLKHQPLPIDEDSNPSGSHDTDQPDSADLAIATYGADFSALGNLILFAHMTRLQFNRRPFLNEIYKKQLTAVVIPKAENQTNTYYNEDPFIIALHMRRGDSCGDPNPQKYESLASDLFSKAQTGGDRKCYQTEVYLRAVARIRELVPKKRPIHVYLATDDVGNVIQDQYPEEADGTTETVMDSTLGVDKWYFLNITRDHFQYKSDSIESMENAENQPLLGETAVTDLWLLSHGHAFVGHLGSRFGKVSWLMATARRNSFIPFFSVDGHSFCCEIDESCGKAKAYMTVNNCLTYGHEYSNYDHENYWKLGSVARKEKFMKDQERRVGKTIRETRGVDNFKEIKISKQDFRNADVGHMSRNERKNNNGRIGQFFDRKNRQAMLQKLNANQN
eukprot:CAMPEP_0116149970 /NCGR_PEP_ID=MMETSP0329-20121206/19270_1 /TAXON_ID=697910 /ORGANISM="Pseudo-nitzschia arenysensis, Strain B593" /LENGTH=486 /DNA_ID=CAMNT_0003646397 /DNA_START=412 /DNA_END=1873 /DNA_ORIENTATION=-